MLAIPAYPARRTSAHGPQRIPRLYRCGGDDLTLHGSPEIGPRRQANPTWHAAKTRIGAVPFLRLRIAVNLSGCARSYFKFSYTP